MRSPQTNRQVAQVYVPSPVDVEMAVASAVSAGPELCRIAAHQRAAALRHISNALDRRREEATALLVAESGKPHKWAAAEVARAISTFEWAAEEARRWSGELLRLDTDTAGENRLALVRRKPRGPVLGIAPFNFPLNLVTHKVAPALAVGAPIVVKPAPATPLSALLLGELLSETDLPAGSWSVLPLGNEETARLVCDHRLPVVSFTGSVPVGWAIKDAVPRKHVTLELGGNATAIVCADWSEDADIGYAATRVATFAMYQAGQSCISVQRVLAHVDIYEQFLDALLAAVAALQTGDPQDPDTDVGPLINVGAAERVAQWVGEAVSAGARVLVGGRRDGAVFEPTVMTDVGVDAKVWCDEVFGPVVAVAPFEDVDDAFRAVNDSRFGLQAGVFTHDLRLAFRAHEVLNVGGVVIGDVPSYRADQMPYGGVGDSGIGREGVRAAMLDLTAERVLVLSGIAV